MNSPWGHSQHDPQQDPWQVDPLTGQPVHRGQHQPQFDGQRGYWGNVQYPPPAAYPPSSGKKGTAGLVAVLVAVVVLLSAGGLGLYFWLTSLTAADPAPHPVAQLPRVPPSTTSVAPPSTRRQPPHGSTTSSSRSDVEPMVPGWQPIADPRTSVAYDVPGGWTVESPSVLVGFEDESGPRVGMHAVATYQDGACPGVSGSYRGHTGIMGEPIEDADPREVAAIGARMWATAAAEVPEDDPSVPRPRAQRIALANGLSAWQATVSITPPDGECSAPALRVTAVSFTHPDAGGAVLFVMYTDQGVPDALPGEVAKKIVSSLRPIG